MKNSQKIDKKHLEQLFKKHYRSLVLFACKFVPADIAEDLVQDVFFQLLKKTDQLVIKTDILYYTYRAIRNKLHDYHKAQLVYQNHLDELGALLSEEELEYYNPEIRQSLLLNENEQAVFAAIETLPPKCREIIKSRYMDGKKASEISLEQGISVRTVETHIYKAIKQLRTALQHVGTFFFL